MKRIPSLDGWRGVAILLVLLQHIQVALTGDSTFSWTHTGQHGVTIFFVLSGFLITTKLVERPIDLKRFYLRRFFRLMPVAWVYLLVLWVVLHASTVYPFTAREALACIFFYRNFVGIGNAQHPLTVLSLHYWSLSIEEQFYLLWPGVLLLAGARKAQWIALGGALACACYRFFHWSTYDRFPAFFLSQVRADALLLGCVAALLLSDPRFRPIAVRWSPFLAWPALATLLFCIARYQNLPPLFESLSIAVLIVFTTLHPRAIAARLCAFPPLAWIGTISYSIYVWQQVFLPHFAVPSFNIAAVCLMPCFAVASYYGIERPGIRLGSRITAKTAASARNSTPQADSFLATVDD